MLKEVGTDAIRFTMISRNADKKIDFDLDVFLQKIKIIQYFIYNMLMQDVHPLLQLLKKNLEMNLSLTQKLSKI